MEITPRNAVARKGRRDRGDPVTLGVGTSAEATSHILVVYAHLSREPSKKELGVHLTNFNHPRTPRTLSDVAGSETFGSKTRRPPSDRSGAANWGGVGRDQTPTAELTWVEPDGPTIGLWEGSVGLTEHVADFRRARNGVRKKARDLCGR